MLGGDSSDMSCVPTGVMEYKPAARASASYSVLDGGMHLLALRAGMVRFAQR